MDSHIVECYTIVKMAELDLHVSRWVKLENNVEWKKARITMIFLYNFKYKLIVHIVRYLSDIKLPKYGLCKNTYQLQNSD